MNTAQYLTPQFIIREVSEMMRDTDFSHGLSRGFYMTQVYNIITELDFDAYANLKTVDYPMPANFLLPYPSDAFNIREVYAWNGACCDICYAKRLYWKTEYNNLPNGKGFTAGVMNDWWGGSYPYIVPAVVGGNSYYPWCEYYFNISQGFIMLSPNCAGFQNLRLVYNNISTPFGENPMIPLFFKEVVKTWVAKKVCEVLMIDEPRKYAASWKIYNDALYDQRTGMWWNAIDRIKMMHSVQRESLGITLTGAGNY